jgi:hypothetical protein
MRIDIGRNKKNNDISYVANDSKKTDLNLVESEK